ncbi:dimethylarginine dimethylaminohydrolase family protein [Gracilibacillus marinus]|jgi:N-dimethylarginine dimethylaminohydrolase|uniref:Dimethylarginine dimethylaminohydrolase family protein n=1 Tax=Gracilibacillus marinus TaxID=630535 RepID=A0ABV8VXG6_9BACI
MINQETEYGVLKKVIVCPPTYMEIKKVINETQKHYENENIDVAVAVTEHENFVAVLKSHNVEVIELEPKPQLNEQVFTRDIGFVINKQAFLAKMQREIRKPEVEEVEKYFEQNDLSYKKVTVPSIEGGDVIVAPDHVFVGLSERTTKQAVKSLELEVPNKQIIPLTLRDDILHLDCAFNIISEKEALIYREAFTKEDMDILKKHYELIEVTEEEQFTLGTNVLSIGNKTILSLPENKQVNTELRKRDYTIIEVPFSEIIKSGGSFRCCTMPIERL